MFNLDKIGFDVDTSKLKQAVEAITAVEVALEGLGKKSKQAGDSTNTSVTANTNLVKSSKEVTASVTEETKVLDSKKKAVSDNAGATEALAGANGKLASTEKASAGAMSESVRAAEKQAIIMKMLSGETFEINGELQKFNGLTRTQAGRVAGFIQKNDLDGIKQYNTELQRTNAITGADPFDQSGSGLVKQAQRVRESSRALEFASKGMNLNRKEQAEHARDMLALENRYKSGSLTLKEYEAEQERVTQTYAEQSSILARNEAQIREMENTRKQAARAEVEAQKTIQQQLQATDRARSDLAGRSEKTTLVAQGFSTGTATSAVAMQRAGVPQSEIDSFLQKAKAQEEATKKSVEYAKAVSYLESAEARLANRLDETNKGLGTKHADELNNYANALKTTGLSADQAEKKLASYRAGLQKVAASESTDQKRNLARAMSVQMGDVGISLAAGQNPLTVLMQQGDQIRGAIQQSKLDGKELSDAMTQTLGVMAKSFVQTAKVIGDFGVALLSIPIKATVAGFKSIASSLKLAHETISEKGLLGAFSLLFSNIKEGTSSAVNSFASLKTAMSSLIGVGIISFFIGIAIAIKDMIQEHESLNKVLATSGGLFGLNKTSIDSLTTSLRSSGITASTTAEALSEITKHSSLSNAKLSDIVVTAKNMKRYLGVDLAEGIKGFADAAEKPAESMRKLAQETGLVSASVLQQVAAYTRQGQVIKASELALKEYKRVQDSITNEAKGGESAFVTQFKYVLELASALQDKIKSIFEVDPIKNMELMKSLFQYVPFANTDRMQKEIDRMKAERKALEDKAKEDQKEKLKIQNTALYDAIKPAGNQYEQRNAQETMLRERGAAAGKSNAEIGRDVAKLYTGVKEPFEKQRISNEAELADFINKANSALEKQKTLLEQRNPLLSPEDKAGMETYKTIFDSMQSGVDGLTKKLVEAQAEVKRLQGLRGANAEVAEQEKIVSQLKSQLPIMKEKQKYFAEQGAEVAKVQAAQQRTFGAGAEAAVTQYWNNLGNAAQSAQAIFTSTFQGLEDAMVSAFTTGELSFSKMATSIMQDMTRMVVRQAIMAPMMAAVFGDKVNGSSSSGSSFGSLLSGGSSLFSGLSSLFGGSSYSYSLQTPSTPSYSWNSDLSTIGQTDYSSWGGLTASSGTGSTSFGIKAFAVGTDYVPKDMVAQIHEGEMIVPKKYNPAILENMQNSSKASSEPSTSINYSPTIQIDSRTDQAQVHQLVFSAVKQGQADLVDQINRGKVKVKAF